MPPVQQLRETYNGLVTQAQDLLTEFEGREDPGSVTAEERAQVDALLERCDELLGQVQTVEHQERQQARTAGLREAWNDLVHDPGTGPAVPAAQADGGVSNLRRVGLAVVRNEAAGGDVTLDLGRAAAWRRTETAGVSIRDQVNAYRRNRQLVATSDGDVVERALTTDTDASGGVLIPEITEAMLYDFLDATAGIRNAGARVITTTGGEERRIPKVDTHFAVAGSVITAESAEVPETEDTYSETVLNAYAYTGRADIPYELLEDSVVDVDAMIIESIGRIISKKTEWAYNNGTGNSQPKGVFHSPPAEQTIVTDNNTAPKIRYSDLMALKYSHNEDILTEGGLAWSMSATTWGGILGLLDNEGRPIFLPQVSAEGGMTLRGDPVRYNAWTVDTEAANTYPLVHGSFRRGYLIRDVRTVRIGASRHVKFLNRQVVYVGELRSDGAVQDPSALRWLKVKA